MSCYGPLKGYRSRAAPGASGKRGIVFSAGDGFQDLPVDVPCGQCIGCRLERSRQWALRCMHEASLYEDNCFLTLTYSDAELPPGGSLDRAAFPLFMKRLRKRVRGGVRFFHCGEYGDTLSRPHYHALLFGYDFPDKSVWRENVRGPRSYCTWRSPLLESLWKFGQSELGSVTFESAAYVARYVTKKVTGERAAAHYAGRTPEYVTMSRRPGVGRPWLDKFGTDVYPSDFVVVRGRKMRPPRYYDLQYASENPAKARELARARRRSVRLEDGTPERLRVREVCVKARLSQSPRRLES